ncbi:MAG: hypothetical protein QOJ08_1397, partial [Ilumatobacteraceae bacterium]
MSGVEFVDPTRVFDGSVPAGTATVLPLPPAGATQALVQISLPGSTPGATGLLMVHSCSVAANPQTDVAIPMQYGPPTSTNQVYVSAVAGVCVTTTIPAIRLIVDLLGWVIPGSGAAYVDMPFTKVATVVGPVSHQPLDVTSAGAPSNAVGLALWLDVISTDNGFAALYPCDQP